MPPTKGFQFYHSRVLDNHNQPMLYVVTKVARGIVYYRPASGGAPDCCDIEQFSRYCLSADYLENLAFEIYQAELSALQATNENQ